LPHTPTISGTGDNTVKFRLENDTADDAQQFTIGTDPFSGLKGVYRNGTLIRPTLGITDLKFEFYTSGAETYYNIIKITAMVEKDILGTRKEPKHIKVEYSDCAYLRNRL